MPAYRFYKLPLDDQGVVTTEYFHSDGAAMMWGLRLGSPAGTEVWQEARFVGRLHAASAEAARAG